MFTCVQPPSNYVSYIALDEIDKKKKNAYNIYVMDMNNNKNNSNEDDIFIPTKEEMENAKKRLEERLKKGTTKGYNKYFKN